MVRIITEYVQPINGRLPRTNRGVNQVKGITIHDTGNRGRGATALAHSRLQLRGGMPNNSWHATVDDKEVRVNYPDTARCWHAANARGNNDEYSIEICVNADGNYYQAVMNAIEFAAIVAKRNNLDQWDLHQHNYWSGKNCPQQIRSARDGVSWKKFVEGVGGYLANRKPDPQPNPQPQPEEDIVASIGELKQVVNDALTAPRNDIEAIQRRLTLLGGLRFGFYNIEGKSDLVYAMEFDGYLTPISNKTWTMFRRTPEGSKVAVGFLSAAKSEGRVNTSFR